LKKKKKFKITANHRPGPVWKEVKRNVPFCPQCLSEGIKNEMKRATGDVGSMFTWECKGLKCYYVC